MCNLNRITEFKIDILYHTSTLIYLPMIFISIFLGVLIILDINIF